MSFVTNLNYTTDEEVIENLRSLFIMVRDSISLNELDKLKNIFYPIEKHTNCFAVICDVSSHRGLAGIKELRLRIHIDEKRYFSITIAFFRDSTKLTNGQLEEIAPNGLYKRVPPQIGLTNFFSKYFKITNEKLYYIIEECKWKVL